MRSRHASHSQWLPVGVFVQPNVKQRRGRLVGVVMLSPHKSSCVWRSCRFVVTDFRFQVVDCVPHNDRQHRVVMLCEVDQVSHPFVQVAKLATLGVLVVVPSRLVRHRQFACHRAVPSLPPVNSVNSVNPFRG